MKEVKGIFLNVVIEKSLRRSLPFRIPGNPTGNGKGLQSNLEGTPAPWSPGNKIGASASEPSPLGARARDGKVGARAEGIKLSYFVYTCSSRPVPKHSFSSQSGPHFRFLCCHSCSLILLPPLRLSDQMCATSHCHPQQRLYGLSHNPSLEIAQVGRGGGNFSFPGKAQKANVLDIPLFLIKFETLSMGLSLLSRTVSVWAQGPFYNLSSPCLGF